MQIGALNFQPYIYNTNVVSSASMGKVSPISDDLLSQKTDFSSLVPEDENINPLRMGETPNFTDILSMQLQIGRNNATRIMVQSEEELSIMENGAEGMDDLLMQDAQPRDAAMDNMNIQDGFANHVSDMTSGVNVLELVQGAGESKSTGMEYMNQMQQTANLYRMQQAVQAYSSFMAG